ncbi:MAG: hypothetical protein WAN39_03205 [Candidatus Cybelea sp.]
MTQHTGAPHWMYPKGFGSAKELLKLRAEGKILSPVTQAAAKWEYNSVAGAARSPFHPIHSGTTPTMWVSSSGFSYLIGLNNRRKAVVAIDTSKNGCYTGETVKVDHQRNVWLACGLNSSFNAGAAQEYSSTGTLLSSYIAGCPSNIPVSSCALFFSGTVDQAESATHVFVGLTYYFTCDAYYNCNGVNGGGVEYWNAGQASAQPTINPFNLSGITLSGSGYLDADASDNVYYTYVGCENAYPYTCGYGLAEYANATSPSGTQTVLLPPGSIGTFGGVNISRHGKILNVLDQSSRTVTQYALPWTGVPLRTLGPTRTPSFGVADPVAGGFNHDDSKMIIGDAYGWLDAITVKTNTAKIHATAECAGGGCHGAAYTPSDK